MRESERPQPALGLAIHQLRIKRGATQKDIAAATGLTTRTMSFIETGKANPTWATLQDIADVLEVSISELAKLQEKLKAEGEGKPTKSAAGRPPSTSST
jgi:transcriptional regulator with XRE-family HTH domain